MLPLALGLWCWVVLRQQAMKAMWSKPISSIHSWFQLELLPLGSSFASVSVRLLSVVYYFLELKD